MMYVKRDKSLIAKHVVGLLTTHLGLRCDYAPSMFDEPLTGSPYELSGMEIYQLLMLVEEEYGVYFRPDDIRRCGFNTINNVVNMILKHI